MKTRNFIDVIKSTPLGRRIYQRQTLQLQITETLCGEMNARRISRKDMAGKIKISEKSLSNMLNGVTEIDIRKVSDILTEMDLQLLIDTEKIPK